MVWSGLLVTSAVVNTYPPMSDLYDAVIDEIAILGEAVPVEGLDVSDDTRENAMEERGRFAAA